MLPTLAGASHRCVIPEFHFDIEHLTELLSEDRRMNPSRYAVVLVSEGAQFHGGEMSIKDRSTDAYGHKKLGGIGDMVSEKLKELSPKFNDGIRINTISQGLGYLVRSGEPDAIDSIVPVAYGNLALNLILRGVYGRLVILHNGCYDDTDIEVVTSKKKSVNIDVHYDTERLRPRYGSFEKLPLLIMTSD
jgi:6-phosphofructokinase 1